MPKRIGEAKEPRPLAEGGSRKPEARPKAALDGPGATKLAVDALARRSLTLRQLEQVLRRKGVGATERAEALARVKELGYIDDAEVARVRAQRLLLRGEAPRLVARRLRAQGVAPETAQAAADEAAGAHSELGLAALALEKKLHGRQPKDLRERQRVFRSLVQKGHRHAVVAKVLGLAAEGGDFDDGADEDA